MNEAGMYHTFFLRLKECRQGVVCEETVVLLTCTASKRSPSGASVQRVYLRRPLRIHILQSHAMPLRIVRIRVVDRRNAADRSRGQ
jgi:hypothetical protein